LTLARNNLAQSGVGERLELRSPLSQSLTQRIKWLKQEAKSLDLQLVPA